MAGYPSEKATFANLAVEASAKASAAKEQVLADLGILQAKSDVVLSISTLVASSLEAARHALEAVIAKDAVVTRWQGISRLWSRAQEIIDAITELELAVTAAEKDLEDELNNSKLYLEDLIGSEVNMLSYPHGAVNNRVRDFVEKAGYQIGATSRFDLNEFGRDPLLLCRTDIWAQDNLSIFEQKLQGNWDWNRWRSTDLAK